MKLRELEALLMAHLQESGEIRADLRWLKRAFWTLAAGGVTLNVSFIATLLSRLWK